MINIFTYLSFPFFLLKKIFTLKTADDVCRVACVFFPFIWCLLYHVFCIYAPNAPKALILVQGFLVSILVVYFGSLFLIILLDMIKTFFKWIKESFNEHKEVLND